jgi:hypothetical protein
VHGSESQRHPALFDVVGSYISLSEQPCARRFSGLYYNPSRGGDELPTMDELAEEKAPDMHTLLMRGMHGLAPISTHGV